ncbi:ComEA family DNA-binding protein [Streptomyces longisporus]|uniref:Helix-hairpin-helix domain-containing protein n=1 Tax=Streptomyces longisporus TaxID=1948 RepID=A0ABP5ZFZ2_STRLO
MARPGNAALPFKPRMSRAGSVLWALVPLLTVGLGTMVILGWAAWRLRSRALALASAVALIVTVVALALTSAPADSGRSSAGGGLIVVVLIGGGLVVTFGVRSRLVDPDRTMVRTTSGSDRAAVEAAMERRARRAEARCILERDPALARELGIGRPDLPRRFDDGGLVDVNHVPLAVLLDLPGFTRELAERVIQVRNQQGLFTYLEELSVYAELPASLIDELAERFVLLS